MGLPESSLYAIFLKHLGRGENGLAVFGGMSAYRLSLLGGFELRDGAGTLLRLPTRKAEALLAFLALSPGQEYARDTLAALLWGESSEQNARASLRQTLSLIGKALGRDALSAEGRAVALAADAVGTDATEFAACHTGDSIEELAHAAQLYRGELLAGLAVGEPGFEEWLIAERERLRECAIDGLARLAARLNERGETDRAIQAVLRLLAIDPLEEVGHRTLMRLYAAQGRRGAALRQYQVCVGVLQRELDTAPESETRALYNTLLRDRQAGRPAPQETPPIHASPLFGRDDELAACLGGLDDACAGSGSLAAILGEAGIGKTRLVEELAQRAVGQGMRMLKGRCFESQQMFPFAPWMDLFRAARVPEDRALLQAIEPPWRTELARLLPELGAGQPEGREDAEAMARRGQLIEAVIRLIAQLAEREPLLLVLEDVHWADELSLRLLAALGRRIRALPVMIVATARQEELPSSPVLKRALLEIGQEGLLRTLTLKPLSEEDTVSLVRMLMRAGEAEQAVIRAAQRIWQTSEGNPFVIIESMRAAAGEVGHAGAEKALPGRVRELIEGHIERLGPSARRLLSLAAVAGREFDFAILQRASGLDEQEASEALEELVRRQILHAVGECFDFVHDRIRRVADEVMLPPSRRTLHLSIAEALEAQYAADPRAVFDRLAYHYARTDRSDKAVRYLTLFAERAARTGAHPQAIAALDEALGHLSRIADPLRERRRFDLVFRKTRSLLLLGRLQEVVALLAPEQALVNAIGDRRLASAYYFRLGAAHVYLGNYADAGKYASRALDEAAACEDDATQGKIHFLLAFSNFWGRPAAGVAHGEQAVACLERVNEPWWLGQSCWILGLNLSYRGRLEEGLAMERRAGAIGERLDDRRLRSSAAWALGFISTLAGDDETAVSSCRQAVDLSPDPLTRMTTVGMLALAHVERHEPAVAIPLLEEAIPQTERFHFAQLHGLYLGFRGEAALQAGDAKAAREFLHRAIEITRQSEYVYGLAWCQRILGRIDRAEGNARLARERFEQAIDTFGGMEAPFEAGRTHLELGEHMESAGEIDSACAHAEMALSILRPLALAPFIERTLRLDARLAMRRASHAA